MMYAQEVFYKAQAERAADFMRGVLHHDSGIRFEVLPIGDLNGAYVAVVGYHDGQFHMVRATVTDLFGDAPSLTGVMRNAQDAVALMYPELAPVE